MTEIIAAARRAEQYAYDGDREGFLAECLGLNELVRKARESGVEPSSEETIALTDAAAASMAQDVARQIESAARGLLALQQPIGASRLLTGALNDPLVSKVRCLKDLYAKVRGGLAHVETFEAFRTTHGRLPAEPVDLSAPRVQEELAAVRRCLARLPQDRAARILLVGGVEMQNALIDQFGSRIEVTRFDLASGGGWFDLPKREGGYDLVVCLNTLQRQPNLEGFVAFLHEQCAAGIYSVPEALKHYSPETTVDAPVYLNLHGFNEVALVKLFDRVGLEGMRTLRTPDGFVIGGVGMGGFDGEAS